MTANDQGGADTRELVKRAKRAPAQQTPARAIQPAPARQLGPPAVNRASDVLALQEAIGNRAVTRLLRAAPAAPLQRAINVDKVAASKEALGITGEVRALEAPKRAPATAAISTYPDASKLNLPDPIKSKSMAKLNFPDQTPEEQAEMWSDATAYDLVEGMLGGGAYNHTEDLVVLSEGYSETALRHEMGHKKQNEGGFNAGTVSVILLEYHNFLVNENQPWLANGAGKPRLAYDAGAAKKKPTKTWAELREHAKGTLHHEQPQAVALLDQIETLLAGDKYASLATQIQANLISEYFQRNA